MLTSQVSLVENDICTDHESVVYTYNHLDKVKEKREEGIIIQHEQNSGDHGHLFVFNLQWGIIGKIKLTWSTKPKMDTRKVVLGQ